MAKRLFWVIILILLFGLIVLSSASTVQAAKQFGSAGYYWRHQLLFGIAPGLLLMWLFWRIDYRKWKKMAFPVLFVALALLVLLFVPHVGLRLKGANSWLDFFGYTFQPAELLKFALVLYLAAWLGDNRQRMEDWRLGLAPFVVVMAVVALLLMLQPDLGTLGIVLVMAAGVYFSAGAPMKQVVSIGLATVLFIVGFAVVSPHSRARLITLIHPAADTRGAGWQINQSLIAIGSGGMWGVGLGQSTQKFGFLPEPMGDSIFAILVEELGLVGGMATLGMFALLAFMLVQIARNAPDAFGTLLCAGMLLWIMTQALVNLAAITGIGPLTGIPLPFISYGGTAMVTLLGGLGIVLNVAERSS